MENAVKEVDKYLHSIYFNPEHPASFSGVDKLYKFVKEQGRKMSRGVIKRWRSEYIQPTQTCEKNIQATTSSCTPKMVSV